ncbi:hypothetical protein LSH36_644g01104 [Paralvinella palmiformis]|uniref:Uncharacterized protein n=1 Tax=Paralvinella palmiformis TaxID=53620 RepID=A0AAD9J3Z6_9ANNE|nr:hypothetical protein LSH36_644g01104 [Paralvinella palmiformis]
MSANLSDGLQNGFSPDQRNGTKNGTILYNGEKRAHFLKRVFQIILEDGVEKGTDVNSKVVEFVHPEILEKLIDLSIPESVTPDDRLLELCRETIRYSVKTGHRRFFNQLYSGLDQYGLAGSWLTDTVNTSQYTYEVAPVFTLMENVVLKHMATLAGYQGFDGIFCPGGSISNLYGINLARYRMFPEIKEEGMHALPKMCLFTSKQGHYSIKKSTALLGIGLKYMIEVDCDETGQMDPVALEKAIVKAECEGLTPFFVNATAGTTVSGAYDPLETIADVCKRHNIWMHVDCCWGGGALLSRKYRHLLKGIELSDSMSWNPHKMMGAPLQCCAFLTKHEQDKCYDVSYDTGDKVIIINRLYILHGSRKKITRKTDKTKAKLDKRSSLVIPEKSPLRNCVLDHTSLPPEFESRRGHIFEGRFIFDFASLPLEAIQCGRKVDVFKIWLMWKAKGDLGFEQLMDNIFDNSRYLVEHLKITEGFKLVFRKPQCTNVCFWYIPICLRDQEETPDWWAKLGKVAPLIKEKMVLKGSLLVGYQPLDHRVNFFRMVISNAETTKEDMEFAIAEIDRLGRDIVV